MTTSKRAVLEAKSRFIHGAVYHALFDRPLAEARRAVIEVVPASCRVLDIASGTGELCFQLAARKHCTVVGVDLSPRMIEFARRRNPYATVRFEIGDGAHLPQFESDSFDFATILFLLHEITQDQRLRVLNEALRLARTVAVVDSHVPLRKNLPGLAVRVVEALGGPDHYRPFSDYLASGGLSGILEELRIPASVSRRLVFWGGCREMVVLNRGADPPGRLQGR